MSGFYTLGQGGRATFALARRGQGFLGTGAWPHGLLSGVQGVGFSVQSLGFRVQGLVSDDIRFLELMVQSLGQGSRLAVQGLAFGA